MAQQLQSWEMRLLQIVMDVTLLHGYLTFKYLLDKEITLREFSNTFALVMCANQRGEWERPGSQARWRGDCSAVSTGGSHNALETRGNPRIPSYSIAKWCVGCAAIICLLVCKTCFEGLCMEDPNVCWV